MNDTQALVAEPPVLLKKSPTRSGEPHFGSSPIDCVELVGDSLVVQAAGRRSAFPSAVTFPQLQATWMERFNVWLHAGCEHGETHSEWWDRVTTNAALLATGGAA